MSQFARQTGRQAGRQAGRDRQTERDRDRDKTISSTVLFFVMANVRWPWLRLGVNRLRYEVTDFLGVRCNIDNIRLFIVHAKIIHGNL